MKYVDIFRAPAERPASLDASGCIAGPSIRALLVGVFVRLIESSGRGFFLYFLYFFVVLFVPHETIDTLPNKPTHSRILWHVEEVEKALDEQR